MSINLRVTAGRAVALASLIQCAAAVADVTIQEQTTIHAFIVKAHGTTTNRIAGNKQRHETQFSCDGVMSMFCGHNKTVDIVRLDRDVTWNMQPKEKQYMEIPFPTPEQRRAVLARQQAAIDKLKSCPRAQPAASVIDTSKCEMTPPVLAVNKTQDVSNFIGHAAQRTNVSLTQSCKIKDTGDVCKMSYSLDVWLTQEDLPGLGDRSAFEQDYQRKLGATGAVPVDATQLNAVLAPYADSLKQLSAKASDFKGYPLKTTFRFAVGGEHCALAPAAQSPPAAQSASSDGTLSTAGRSAGAATALSAEHAAGWETSGAVQRATGNGVGGYVAGSAAGAFTQSVIGGLFAKKTRVDPPPIAAAQASDGSRADPAGVASTIVAEFSVETTAIDPAPISADQFEVPGGWKKLEPKAEVDRGLPSCPST